VEFSTAISCIISADYQDYFQIQTLPFSGQAINADSFTSTQSIGPFDGCRNSTPYKTTNTNNIRYFFCKQKYFEPNNFN
ncbi:hypothetical protein OAP01_10665, partial [Akkermansiaceae bacterium]|nr:hypothetical protein [Akkermansiaceae bacterium]